jgi:hypothetical protein
VCRARYPLASAQSPELVVLLQDASRLGRDAVMVARLHRVTEQARRRTGFYDRLALGQHPAALLIPPHRVQGATGELYVSLLTIESVPRADILERRGSLTEGEMRQVSERLVKTLELDISHLIRPVAAPSRESGRAQLPWWSQRGDWNPRPATLEAGREGSDEPRQRSPRVVRLGGSGDPQGGQRSRR